MYEMRCAINTQVALDLQAKIAFASGYIQASALPSAQQVAADLEYVLKTFQEVYFAGEVVKVNEGENE